MIHTGRIGITQNFELAFTFLLKISTIIGLSFRQFYCIYMMAGILLLVRFLKKMNVRSGVVFLLIIISCFTNWLIQIRSFFSIMIILNSLCFLFEKRKKEYLLGVLLATLFHSSSIIFVFLIFWDKLETKSLIRLVLVLPIVITVSLKFVYEPVFSYLSTNSNLLVYRLSTSMLGVAHIHTFSILFVIVCYLFMILLGLIYIMKPSMEFDVQIKSMIIIIGISTFGFITPQAYRLSLFCFPLNYSILLRLARELNLKQRYFVIFFTFLISILAFAILWSPLNESGYDIWRYQLWKSSYQMR